MAHYECTVIVEHYYQDNDNYPANKTTRWTESADALSTLYEQLAAAKIENTWGKPERYGEYQEVEFGLIRKIDVIEEFQVDDAVLDITKVWSTHRAKLDAERLEEERKTAEHEAKRKAQQEHEERAMFARLKEKFGEK